MEEQQLSSGSCSCPPFGLQAWYFVHDDNQRVIMLNIRFEERWMNNSLVVATIGKTVTLPCRVLMQEVLSSIIPRSFVWPSNHPLLFAIPISSPTPFFALFLSPSIWFLFLESSHLLCHCLFLFNMTIFSECDGLMVGSEEINDGPFDGGNWIWNHAKNWNILRNILMVGI